MPAGLQRLLVMAALALAPGVHGQAPAHPEHHLPAPSPATSEAELTRGEVRKVDRDLQKITLRHGPIVNLDMPEMTMVFRVPDAALLEGLKSGDKVRFRAEKVDGQFTVTRIEAER